MFRAATALLLLLIISELLLRLVFGLGNPVVYQYDAACGYLPVPNQHVVRFFCHNDINSYSMRSPPIAAHKPRGVLRIMFVGDSVTYGTTHVDQPKMFTSLLASELPARLHRPVEVLNASTGAWAVGNELGYLQSRGTFESDVVIFVLNTGDLSQPDNHQPLTAEDGYPDHRPPLALYELFDRYLIPRIRRHSPSVDAGSRPADEAVNPELPHVLECLEKAKALARRSGASFGIVYSPAAGKAWETAANSRSYDRLRHWAAENGVFLLDLTPAYATATREQVYQDGIHLREKGNELAAHAIENKWPWPHP